MVRPREYIYSENAVRSIASRSEDALSDRTRALTHTMQVVEL